MDGVTSVDVDCEMAVVKFTCRRRYKEFLSSSAAVCSCSLVIGLFKIVFDAVILIPSLSCDRYVSRSVPFCKGGKRSHIGSDGMEVEYAKFVHASNRRISIIAF